jgi:hypothetical protein
MVKPQLLLLLTHLLLVMVPGLFHLLVGLHFIGGRLLGILEKAA